MSQSDDLPPPRRPLFFPVVIATVLLSIIGMSAGLVLGSRHESLQRAGDQTNYVPGQPTVSPASCPEQMHATARRVGFSLPMTQVLKVRADDTGTVVWICENANGQLFYQANKGGDEARWVEGETALFLSNVTRDGDGYLAKAVDGNTFFVNKEVLKVVKKGKTRESTVQPE